MATKLLAVAAVALACLAAPVSASSTDDFRACFCWDPTTDTFCGGTSWYDRDPCRRWAYGAFAFTIPAIIGIFVLVFFPIFFYVARSCCNCCGGRHRTYGCCCSDTASRHRFPGYSNRTVFLSKLSMCVVFGAFIYYAVGGYVTNAHLHNDLVGVLTTLTSDVDSVATRGTQAAASASVLAAQALMSNASAQLLQESGAALSHRIGQIHTVLDDIRRAENDQSLGRAEAVYRYPSCVLLVYVFVMVAMLGNCRKVLGPLMVLACLTTAVVGVIFVPHMVIAEGVTAMCDSYNETVVPLVVGAIETQKGCNDPAFFALLNETALNVEATFWAAADTANPSTFCSAVRTVCGSLPCQFNTCGQGSGSRLPFRSNVTGTPYHIEAIQSVVTVPFAGAGSSVVGSIRSCASAPTVCATGSLEQQAAQAIMEVYNSTYPALQFLYLSAYPASLNCSEVRANLQTPLHDDICVGLNRRTTNIATVLGVLYLIGVLSIPVIIRGMKRFVPLRRNQSLGQVARETVFYYDAAVNGVPVPDECSPTCHAINEPDGAMNEEQPLRSPNSAYYRRTYGLDDKPQPALPPDVRPSV